MRFLAPYYQLVRVSYFLNFQLVVSYKAVSYKPILGVDNYRESWIFTVVRGNGKTLKIEDAKIKDLP